jgi:hypothetical protein
MWEVKAMADPHQQLLVGPSAAAEAVKLVSNALAVDHLDLAHRSRDLVAHVVAGEVEFGRSKAAGILDHQQRHDEDEHLERLHQRELVAVKRTVLASNALRRRSASATAGTLDIR